MRRAVELQKEASVTRDGKLRAKLLKLKANNTPKTPESDEASVKLRRSKSAKSSNDVTMSWSLGKRGSSSDKKVDAFREALTQAERLLGRKAMGGLTEQYRGLPGGVPLKAVVVDRETELEGEVVALKKSVARVNKATLLLTAAKDKRTKDQDRLLMMLRCGLELMSEMAKTAQIDACNKALRFRQLWSARPATPNFIKLLRDDDLNHSQADQLSKADAIIEHAKKGAPTITLARWFDSSESF